MLLRARWGRGLALALSWFAGATALPAQPSPAPAEAPAVDRAPRLLGWQATGIAQATPGMRARYSGPNSFTDSSDIAASQTVGLYGGWAPTDWLESYLDVEFFRGAGISRVVGLGALTNGDVLRQGSGLDLGKGPYIARLYARGTIPLSAGRFDADPGQGSAPRHVPTHRLEIIAGRLALSDQLDINRYANSTRSQFMNWGLWNNTAWDFAANTRGYSNGIVLALITPRWAVRAASFQMPTQANGNTLDGDLANARGDNLEFTWMPHGPLGTVVRLLGYHNLGRMGNYRDVTAAAAGTGTPPDITSQDLIGSSRWGAGLNVEVPLAWAGQTGLFARAGWSDGATESFAFTEVDRHLSVGVQLAGEHWGRNDDQAGIGTVVHGLSAPHRDYLAAGGLGFLLGDGALDYGVEWATEFYYRVQLGRWVQLSPDLQFIVHPGYNQARGPAVVGGVRVRIGP